MKFLALTYLSQYKNETFMCCSRMRNFSKF